MGVSCIQAVYPIHHDAFDTIFTILYALLFLVASSLLCKFFHPGLYQQEYIVQIALSSADTSFREIN